MSKGFISIIAATLISLGLVGSLDAKQGIEEAFGITLGQTIDEDYLTYYGKTTTGHLLYSFDPVNPHPSFTTYVLVKTPKTGIVAEIWATGTYKTSDECSAHFRVLE